MSRRLPSSAFNFDLSLISGIHFCEIYKFVWLKVKNIIIIIISFSMSFCSFYRATSICSSNNINTGHSNKRTRICVYQSGQSQESLWSNGFSALTATGMSAVQILAQPSCFLAMEKVCKFSQKKIAEIFAKKKFSPHLLSLVRTLKST